MAKNNNLHDFLTDIANTIREENGTTELINPQDFGLKITGIGDKLRGYISGTLTEIKASDLKGITRIPGYAFYVKDSLTSITLPDSITSIGGPYAFGGCTGLKTLVIPASAIPDDDDALYSMFYSDYGETGNIENLTAPANIVYVAPVSHLVNVVINSGSSLEESFLSGSQHLESVTISNTIESIGPMSFTSCPNLVTIIVEDGNTVYHSHGNCLIETQSKTLLVGCKNSVIPDDNSVTNIGGDAFHSCRGLTSISIPSSVTSIGNQAFYGCKGLTSISIPSSVTNIGGESFYNCTGLSSLVISNSVTSIGDQAFFNCPNLETIIVEDGNTVYHSHGNCLIETQSKTLLVGCKNSVIPDDNSVTNIGGDAFHSCRGLTSISIPSSVTSIGGSAFNSCDGLTSISIPSSVTSIGGSAFYYCKNLASVIYEGQPIMSTGIYSYCTKIAKYDFRNATSVPTLGHQSYLDHATGCKIIVPDALYASWKAATNWSALTGVVWIKASEYVEE